MRYDRLPLSYVECRTRFRRAVIGAGLELETHPIAAIGPDTTQLSIDVSALGASAPSRVLFLLSGVHGVEGFVSSAVQCELLARLDPTTLPDDMAVVMVHSVNPWGMAWWRRQNESNVDLNRNWRRDSIEPLHNDPYDRIHGLACPDTDDLPQIDELFGAAGDLVAEKGFDWVRDAITIGQYRHADGLHYGGERTEESNRIVEAIVAERLSGAERVLVIDLHTGHGPRGEITLLSDEPPDSDQDRFFTTYFPSAHVEATADNPEATTGVKSAKIGNGIRDMLSGAECYSTSLEWGTASDTDQLVATYQEQWVFRRGNRGIPAHAAAVWAYRNCFCPDDADWEHTAMAAGRAQMDDAIIAVANWGG